MFKEVHYIDVSIVNKWVGISVIMTNVILI